MENRRKKIISWAVIIVVITGIAFGAGFSAGLSAQPEINKVTDLQDKTLGMPQNVDFSPFWKAWNIINEKYVSSAAAATNDQDKVWGAISGLAASLGDPYTVFFPPEENKIFTSEINGNFDGVGMEMGVKNNIITVIAPLKNTPAELAGILPGDQIIKIDDNVTAGMSIDEAVKLIRGPKGTAVRLTIARQGKKSPFEVSVVRDTIEIPTIDTKLKPAAGATSASTTPAGPQRNGVFVISLYSFTADSPSLFQNALRQFIASGSNKLILDLRGNPGGYLEAAVDIASWFLPPGKVVVSEDFGQNGPPVYYRSHREDIFNKNLKFVILVNGGTASAAEILAGALQEYGIAKLVGTTTFGKGVVQELESITPDTSLKVTVARWLTPLGHSISEMGIKPDIEVPMTADDAAKGKDPQMDEAVKLLSQM